MRWLYGFYLSILGLLQWLPPLIGRLVIGLVFIESGWGKLQHLDKVVEFFRSLHIPMPEIQAPFVASIELSCGALVLVGLLTRIAALPLIGTMAVAIMTAKLNDINEISDLFSLSEFLYIVILLWLIIAGPGVLSLDRVFAKPAKTNIKKK